MRIIINAYQYSTSITGTDRMACNFLRELQKIDTQNEYIIICSSVQYIQPVITSTNFRIIQPRHYIKHPLLIKVVNKLWRETLNLRLKPLGADVYLSFHNMKLPKKRIAKKMIASNLDLIPMVIKEYGDLIPRQLQEIRDTAESADEFFSISNYSKQELHGILQVPLDKIKVIQLAADDLLSNPPKRVSGIPEKFIFTVGGSEPRKNVITVAKAYATLPLNLQKEFPLLIVGGEWHGKSLAPLNLSPYITALGYIDDTTLSYLYSKSSAFIFASKYEGFGFTILEAMSAGIPVISAAGTSLDEVAGNATLKFDPDSVENLREQLLVLLGDNTLQKKLSEAGKKRSKEFSWENSARELHRLITH